MILLAFGFGGGVLVSGIVSETVPREPNKVERRAAAPEAAPPTIAAKPVPVVPAPTEPQASTPAPASSAKPNEIANAPQPPAPAQQQAVTPAADAATPPLGPQQPVALVNPDQSGDLGDLITQQARQLADERRNAEPRKKAENPRQRETRRAQQRRAPTGSSADDDASSDVRGERRYFMLRERRDFGGPPLLRLFGNED